MDRRRAAGRVRTAMAFVVVLAAVIVSMAVTEPPVAATEPTSTDDAEADPDEEARPDEEDGDGQIDQVPDAVPGRYIVTLADAASPGDVTDLAAELAAEHDGEVVATYAAALDGFAVAMSDADALALSADPAVAAVEEDGVVRAMTTQPDPPAGLDRIDQHDLPLDHAYTYATTGDGVTAYIIDSGIRVTHQEFGGRASIGIDAVDDGHNGADCNGHGTHVAGTVGGTNYGVAKDVSLVAVRVLNCDNTGTTSGVIAGIDWVTAHHVSPAVANMSLGVVGGSNALDGAVQGSMDAGVPYVLAAGNTGNSACSVSPARLGDALTVGATDSTDARASFTSFGSCLDLFAPGVAVDSAWHTGDTAVATQDGTSMAAPHVAGVVARFLEDRPDATPHEVSAAVIDRATVDHVVNPGPGSPNRLVFADLLPAKPLLTIVADSRPDDASDVTFDVCPTAGGVCQQVVLDDDQDPTRRRTATLGPLEATTYTVTQQDRTGWDLTALTCDHDEAVDVGARQATVTLSAAEHVTCRFTNESAAVTVRVDATPNAAQDFGFGLCPAGGGTCTSVVLDDDNDATLPASRQLAGLTPGTYEIVQDPAAGWDLTAVQCQPGGPGDSVDLANRRATVVLSAHERLTCSFTETQRAHLTVVTDLDPDGGTDVDYTICKAAASSLCASSPAPETVSLDDDDDPTLADRAMFQRAPGTYVITQSAPAGWGLSSLTCTSGEVVDRGRDRAIVELSAGESTTCTFASRRATIVLVQETEPDGPQDFAVDACPAVGGCQQIVLDDDTDPTIGRTATLVGLDPGLVTLTQAPVPGYGLTSINCTAAGVDLATRTATVLALPGQVVTCTFRVRATTLTVVQDTDPNGPQDFTFSQCGPGAGADPCSAITLDDDADSARPRSSSTERAEPGTYTVTRDEVEGWGTTSISCDTGGIVDLDGRTATIELQPGEQATCTFTARATSLAVTLDVQPDAPDDVTFTACPDDGPCRALHLDDDPSDPTRAASGTWTGLAPGRWELTHEAVAGWGTTALTCGSGEVDVADGRVVVELAPGEQVSCAYVDRVTRLTIVQNTAPDGPDDFTFDVCADNGDPCTTVVLDDDTDPARANSAVLPALLPDTTYTVVQREVSDWAVATITCDSGEVDLDARQVTVTLTRGEQRTCTFGVQRTTITVIVDSTEHADPHLFTFTGCAGPGGANGCGDFVLEDDVTDPAVDRERTFGPLTPGTYTVRLNPVPGYVFTNVSCTHGIVSRPDGSATIALQPGNLARCTFQVTPSRLRVFQATSPSAAQDFPFTGCVGVGTTGGCGSFSLDNDADPTLPRDLAGLGLAPGTYTVTQGMVPGYGLTSLECRSADGLTGEVDLNARRATVVLEAGEQMTCTFRNAPTSLTVVQDTNPTATQDFAFRGCRLAGGADACGDSVLDDDTDPTRTNTLTHTALPEGLYTITQAPVAAFPLTDLRCTDGVVSLSRGRATVDLEPGEQVTCTFVNGPAPPPATSTLTIVQDTSPNDGQDFTFIGCSGPGGATGCGPFSLDDDTDATLASLLTATVVPGTEYSVTHGVVPGYGTTSITCTNGEVSRRDRRVTIELRAGEQATCTFVAKPTSLTIVQDTSPNAAVDAHFTGCGGPGGATGCSTFLLDDDSDATLPRSITATALASTTYAVTQEPIEGYGLTITCSGGGETSVSARRATVLLDPGEQVTCTFRNDATSFAITQDTIPNGPQDFAFSLCGPTAGASTCDEFSLDNDTNATLPSTVTRTALAAGTYVLSQAPVAGFGVTGISCTRGDIEVRERRVTLILDPGDGVSCTFQVRPTLLTLVVDSTPNDGQDVGFATCGPTVDVCTTTTLDDDADATLPASASLVALAPGTYVIQQAPIDAWGLTQINCTGGETDLGNGRARVVLSPGEQVTCTFVNGPTTLTVVQDSDPNGAQDRSFSLCGTACSTFDLDDDSDATLPSTRTFSPLAAGTYTLTQSPLTGHALVDLRCTGGEVDLAAGLARVELSPGEQVTCTFVTRVTSLTIAVDNEPLDAQDFSLERCGPVGCTTLVLDDDLDAGAPNLATLTVAEAGTYTISEDSLPVGWGLTDLSCSTAEDIDLASRRVTVRLNPGEQTTCTFGHRRTMLTVVTDTVADAARDIGYQLCPSSGPCTSFLLDDDANATLARDRVFTTLAPGRYVLTQSAMESWVVTTITCGNEVVDLAARRVTIDLALGEQTTCQFTNRTPTITIVQTTAMDGVAFSTQDFDFTLCRQFAGCSSVTLDDDHLFLPLNTASFGDLPAGNFVLTQSPVAGYELRTLTCSTDETVNLANRSVAITLSGWEQVTCTFFNARS